MRKSAETLYSLPGDWIGRDARPHLRPKLQRIIVVKPDHIGDLLIAARAFGLLRRFFPDAHIDLICGPWNVGLAERLGIFDGVYGVNLFHEVSGEQSNLQTARQARRDGIANIEALQLGPYDLAIDLRHDRDSRPILASLQARIYAGYGGAAEFPFLDIALPMQQGLRVPNAPYELTLAGKSFYRGSNAQGVGTSSGRLAGSGRISTEIDDVEIDIWVEGARSPSDCGTVLQDLRQLGVAMTDIILLPVSSDSGLPTPWSQIILSPQHPQVTLLSGWDGPEPWGVWGLGSLCRLRVALPPSQGESAVQIDISLIAHVNSANPEVSCRLSSIDGSQSDRLAFRAPQNRGSLAISVPRRQHSVTLVSVPFRLGAGGYEGALRLYIPGAITPEMGVTLILRGIDSGTALMIREVSPEDLVSGLFDIPLACRIETGEEALSLEVHIRNATAFQNATIEMLTLDCVEKAKLNIPISHMEKRACLLVTRVALDFSDDPLFAAPEIAMRLTEPRWTSGIEYVDECAPLLQRISSWRAGGVCVVGVALGCNSEIRKWPRHYFVELLKAMMEIGPVQPIFIGSPGECTEASEACQALGLDPALHSLCGAVKLSELGRVLAELDLFIGSNTGTTHYAGQVGTRTIGIYSGTNHPREWGPVGANASWITRDEPCAPCFLSELKDCHFGHVCLRNLLPRDVLEIVAPDILAVLSRHVPRLQASGS